jgi:hypothetical protein
MHTALGLAVCAVAVLLRPQSVGTRSAVVGTALLALGAALVITVYDRLVYPAEVRTGVEATVLPIAAVIAFAMVVATPISMPLRALAGLTTAVIIGGVPHLGSLRAVGREGTITRLLRDAGGVAILLPVLVAGTAPSLTWWHRAALLGICVALVTHDTLRTEAMPLPAAVATSTSIGAIVAGAALIFPADEAHLGVHAALLLVLWYGLRGLGSALFAGRRAVLLCAEYGVFIAAALVAIRWSATH